MFESLVDDFDDGAGSWLLNWILVIIMFSGVADFNKAKIMAVVIPMGLSEPIVHQADISLYLFLPAVTRKAISQIAEITLKTWKPRVLYGVIVIMAVLNVFPMTVFGMISVPAPGL